MAMLKGFCPIPNSLIDVHLSSLSHAELKVLLVVLRQTQGFIHPNGSNGRKDRDWLSQKFFGNKTGLSGRSVSTAIDSLVKRNLIIVTDSSNQVLRFPSERRGAFKLYYASTLVLAKPSQKTNELICINPVKQTHNTKEIHQKKSCEITSQGTRLLSDQERLHQLLHSKV